MTSYYIENDELNFLKQNAFTFEVLDFLFNTILAQSLKFEATVQFLKCFSLSLPTRKQFDEQYFTKNKRQVWRSLACLN